MGERIWRVFFGVVSLPLAFSTIVFFINHRYDGVPLWDFKLVPGEAVFGVWGLRVWVLGFVMHAVSYSGSLSGLPTPLNPKPCTSRTPRRMLGLVLYLILVPLPLDLQPLGGGRR